MAKFKKKLSKIKSSKMGPRKVAVPNLIGLSRSAAQSLLTSLGLTYTESSTTTSVSSEDNTISSQNISSSLTINIGEPVSITYRSYVAPYSNPPPYDNTYYNPYSNPPPYDNTYSNPPPYDNTYSNPPPYDNPYYNPPPSDCETASCQNDPGRLCCLWINNGCRAC